MKLGALIHGDEGTCSSDGCANMKQIAIRKKKEKEYLEMRRKGVGGGYRNRSHQRSSLVHFNLLKWNASTTWSTTCRLHRGVSCVSWDVEEMTHFSVEDLREKGEQLPVIAFDVAFVKTTSASGETETENMPRLSLLSTLTCFFVKVIFLFWEKLD